MMRNEQIVKKIIDAYEKNVFELKVKNLGHFFLRAYRVTGNRKYLRMIAYFIFVTKPNYLAAGLSQLEKNKFKKPQKISNKSSERKKSRRLFYRKNPQAALFDGLSFSLLTIEKTNLHEKVFKKQYTEIFALLKKINFRKIYCNEAAIRQNSSFTFNSVYLLEKWGIDKTINQDTIALFKKTYFTEDGDLNQALSRSEFQSLIYSLTHIIISESQYYQVWVKKYAWILKFFSENTDDIIKATTLDIIAEVALCFKLCRREKAYAKVYKKLTDYLKTEFDFSKLNEDFNYLNQKEHTCSLLVILFSDLKKFYKGPSLVNQEI